MINKNTKLCISLAIHAGNFGTLFHNYLYEKMQLNYIYKAFATENLKEAIGGIRAFNIRGCGVSMPYKVECIQYLDEVDESANSIRAVNTIVNTDGYLKGYNTDYIAVKSIFTQFAFSENINQNSIIAIRGNGGMAKAVLRAIFDCGFKNVIIIARNEISGKSLAKLYNYTYQLEAVDVNADILINATSIGMANGDTSEVLAFKKEAIEKATIVCDVVAIPVNTPLIQEAYLQEKQIVLGSDIAILQSLEQFILYTGVQPSIELIKEANHFARKNINT